MDKNVRSLLALARNNGVDNGIENLHQAYNLMRATADKQLATDSPQPFGLDLLVICAEIAIDLGQLAITRSCLKLYFLRSPPTNQFLCRAYLCQARLLAPTSANDIEHLEKAVVYVLKAVALAKDNSRYDFLVYNASVIYWEFCRSFLKPRYRQHLSGSLHQIVKALDDIDDKDYEWRAQLMIALIECHLDAGKKQEASHITAAAASFIKQNVPSLYKQVFGLMVRHQLVESEKYRKDIKTSPELNVYHRICRLKGGLETNELERDPGEEMLRILAVIQGQPEDQIRAKPLIQEKSGRTSSTPDGGLEKKKSPTRIKARTPSPPGPRKSLLTLSDKNLHPKLQLPYLLLELGRLALDLSHPDICQTCIQLIRQCTDQVQDESFFLEYEFLQCDHLVKSLKGKQESYNPNIIQLRLQAIKQCDEAITNACRMKAPTVIQAGCITQWNLCLPLLQNNLRRECRRPLTNVASALELIQSLLVELRCQVHMELAKCEEDQEQIQAAIDHLHKALHLDDSEAYKERLHVALHRLEVRAELYKIPEHPEDHAAMIIEQARKADSGTLRMKRSLLVRAGQTLAPDAFLLVLDSENDSKEAVKGLVTPIRKLAMKTQQFKSCVSKTEGHLRRLGDKNDKERAHLWADLARTARKQEVWDVCRVAARFCLLYDDGRWKIEEHAKETSRRGKSQDREAPPGDVDMESEDIKRPKVATTSEKDLPLYEKDLIRLLASVNFINGEALIHLLRCNNIEVGDQPAPPVDRSKRPKGFIAKKADEDPDWIEYCDWIKLLTEEAVHCFMRAATLGIELREAWIVCNSAAYVWNYYNKVMSDRRHRIMVEPLQTLLNGMKKAGHAGETVLLVNICYALALGLMQPWLPSTDTKVPIRPNTTPESDQDSPRKPGTKVTQPAASKGQAVVIAPEALPDLKKAVEVCEYAMKTTDGDNPLDIVPLYVRYPLLQLWVMAKQLSQAQISKTLGTEDERGQDGQVHMTRAIVAIEMLSLNPNGIMEFRECPSLQQAVDLMMVGTWSDRLVELQLWTRLAFMALESKTHQLVAFCANKALAFAESFGKKVDSHHYVVQQEMLHYAACIYGQSLMQNTQGKNTVRRKAMQQFLDGARFARNAKNYDLVMTAARHYWNACLSLINQPMERELLNEPLTILLQCITDTTDKNKYRKEQGEEEDGVIKPGNSLPLVQTGDNSATKAVEKQADEVIGQGRSPGGNVAQLDDDLTLRASLYGVLFQSYADKGEWDAGLKAMEQAISDMPRTNHRLLIFKHLVVVKAKIGLDVALSIQKFKNEREDYVAQMWRRVALCSRQKQEQLDAYQHAIEALVSPWTDWQRVDYLIEFGQWLYCSEFPLEDCMDQIDWAIDILHNMKYENKSRTDTAKGKRDAKSKRSAKTPPVSALKPDKKGKKSDKTASKDVATPIKPSQAPDQSEKSTSDMGAEPSDDLVPKKSVIGVLPSNSSLTISDLHNITQLEGLFRAHIIQAQIAGRTSVRYRDYCFMALEYVLRMWQVSLGCAGPVIKEIVRQQAADPVDSKPSDKAKKKKDTKEVEKKEKPKRKGPLDYVPSSVEEWSAYDVPDEALEAFKHSTMTSTGINCMTITKPMLTLFYLDVLTTELRKLGYNHLVLPLLAMADTLTRQLIKDRPLNALIHLKAMEVCVELNLSRGAAFHEQLADYELQPDEQARAHQDVELWKEHQSQVAKEELRIQQSLVSHKNNNKTRKMTEQDIVIQQKMRELEESGDTNHHGNQIGSVHIHNTWIQTAEILIRNGVYQPARKLLNEAHMVAKAFDKKEDVGRVLYLLGELSYQEAQYGQAVILATEAQRVFDGKEMFWFETTVLIVNALLKDFDQRDNAKLRKARAILLNALNTFNNILDEHPNKMSINSFILASLEAKLGSVQVQILISQHDNLLKTKVMSALSSACQKMQRGYKRLIELSYNREAVLIMKELAGVYKKIARILPINEDKHEYYIKGYHVMKEANTVSSNTMQDVLMSSSIQELKALSCPVQREAVEIKTLYGELMLEMLAIHVEAKRQQQIDHMNKGSVLRALEELVRETPQYSNEEREWLDTMSVICDVTLSLLSEAHSHSAYTRQLKARCMCGLGRCLHLMELLSGPDAPTLWKISELEEQRLAGEVGGEGELAPDDGDDDGDDKAGSQVLDQEPDTSSPEYLQHCRDVNSLKIALDLSTSFLSTATEILTQTVNLSLSKGLLDSASSASLELVECCGQFDPLLAGQYLAIHQSCQASLYMQDLLLKALYDPHLSQQAALMHQRHNLQQADVTSNLSSGAVVKSIMEQLNSTSEAWKRLQVSPNHLDLTKEFPPNYTFIILQHSPDRTKLYGCVLEKPKLSGGGKATPKSSASPKTKVFCVRTSPQRLDAVLGHSHTYRHDVMQTLLKKEYQRSQMAQRDKMKSNLDENLRNIDTDSGMIKDWEADEQRLHSNFSDLLIVIEDYLRPITSQIEGVIRRPQSGAEMGKARAVNYEPAQEFTVLLIDHYLMQLPLEALQCFQAENISSLTREISLQMLYHKFHIEPLDDAEEKAKKEREKNKPPSRIPGLRDASKKMAKIIPLDRPISSGFLPIDTHAVRFICDPHLDCSETEVAKPLKVLSQVIEEHNQQFTPRWLGVGGNEYTPSQGEYEVYMMESSAFIYYGMERFSCQLPPHKMAALNLLNCQFVMLLDLTQTNKSFSRQAKIDVLKTADVLSLEKPVETALLLGLTGIKCVCLNQWHCTLSENANRLQAFMKDLLAKGKSTGQTTRLLFDPNKRHLEEEAELQAFLEAEEAKKSAKNNKAVAQDDDNISNNETPPQQEPLLEMGRHWYNMVCYGLPNLIVTQIGKG